MSIFANLQATSIYYQATFRIAISGVCSTEGLFDFSYRIPNIQEQLINHLPFLNCYLRIHPMFYPWSLRTCRFTPMIPTSTVRHGVMTTLAT